MPLGAFFIFLHLYALFVAAAPSWTSSPLEPAAIPLAVRSPYFSAWLAGGRSLSETWPTFWNGGIVGWASFARVDGKAFRTMGNAGIDGAAVATQTSVTLNASSTHFVLSAGGVELLYTFLSPVEPNDLVRQSLPFSYLSISARSTDGAAHDVQVYVDISAEWVSGDSQKIVNWSFEQTPDGRMLAHKLQLANEQLFTEVNDRIEYGSAYLATSAGVTYTQGPDVDTRTQFVKNGQLSNSLDATSRAISDRWPVFAFSTSFGGVPASGIQVPSATFVLGHVRDPLVQYITAGGAVQQRSPYWMTQWTTVLDAMESFLYDYDTALASATTLDARIVQDATAAVGANYASLLRLSVQQAFAAIEITVGHKADGSLNSDDVLAFMKEISSNGNVNTVDVLYPFWPLVLYSNPTLGKYLLDPIFRYQASGQYPNKYALHDLGAHYPNATGHNDGQDEPMPLEESGNMLVMALSYAQHTGDTSQLKQYVTLLVQWSQFLVSNALVPAEQISTDDFAGALANQTNLAIKGIIGIAAMGEIMQLLGDDARASTYKSFVKDYVTRWRALATSHDGSHLMLSYGNDASWGLAYNLYADKLLGLEVFPQDVYDTQSAWYRTKLTGFGIPLDTRSSVTKSDWEIWTAAITDAGLRGALVDSVYRYAASAFASSAGAPLGDLYFSNNGSTTGFRARPVVGGHFAILALQMNNSNANAPGAGGSGDSGGVGDLDLNGSLAIAVQPFMVVSLVTIFSTACSLL